MNTIAPIFVWLAGLLAALGLAALFWPRKGLLARRRQKREQAGRVLREDALKHLCQVESAQRRPTLQSVAGALHLKPDAVASLLQELEQLGLVSFASGELRLTAEGHTAGAQIIRAHRLWECHLAERTGLRETEWHAQAEDQEHALSPQQANALSAQLGHPTHDPHGDPIPPAGGALVADAGRPSTTLARGESGLIVHLEDEPASLYAQLVAMGLWPGMTLRVIEKQQQIRFQVDGGEHALTLTPLLANQIEVVPMPETAAGVRSRTLADFHTGQRTRVVGLALHCRGPERRRLLDLGFVPGTIVDVEMASPSGEPTAYRLRETVIALHREQARLVLVEPAEAPKP